MSLLDVTDLTIAYGAVTAVRGVSLRIDAGETVAVLGANGAGKTSLLRAISGLEPARSGSVAFDGEDITGERPERIARRGIAHVPDNRGIFPTLSVSENLRMGLYGAGRDRSDDGAEALEEVLDLFPILRDRADQAAGNLSGGQQQMLTIGRSLLQDPRLLMLDEMSMGLAPAIVEELFVVVRQLKERGIAVLLVEQFVGQALGVADRVMVLEQGSVVVEGAPSDLAGDELASAYLGGDDDVEVSHVPPPPEHVSEPVRTRLGPRQLRQLERLAAERGVSVDDLIASATEQLLAGETADARTADSEGEPVR